VTAMVENLQLGREEVVQMLEVPALVPAIKPRRLLDFENGLIKYRRNCSLRFNEEENLEKGKKDQKPWQKEGKKMILLLIFCVFLCVCLPLAWSTESADDDDSNAIKVTTLKGKTLISLITS